MVDEGAGGMYTLQAEKKCIGQKGNQEQEETSISRILGTFSRGAKLINGPMH